MTTNFFTEGEDFINYYTKDKDLIYLTSVTKEFSEMAYNWYLSLKEIKQEHLALMVALDKECYSYLKYYNLPCALLDVNILSNNTGKEWIENEKNTKLLSLHYLYKKYDFDIVMSDIDIIFLKNPIQRIHEFLTKEEYNVVVMSDKPFTQFNLKRKFRQETVIDKADKRTVYELGTHPQYNYGCENGGFCYVVNSKGAQKFKYNDAKIKNAALDYLKVFFENSDYYKNFPKEIEAGNLQTITNFRFKELNFKVKTLDCFEFVNGSAWKISYIKERIKNSCYLVHYNFSDFLAPFLVREDKKDRMLKDGYWFVPSS